MVRTNPNRLVECLFSLLGLSQDLGVSPVLVDSLEGDDNSGPFFFSVVEVVEVEDFFLLETILLKQLLGNNARNNGSNDLHRFLDASHHCEQSGEDPTIFFCNLDFSIS